MNKAVWTVAKPPRVYEVAKIIGTNSPEVISLLRRWGFSGNSASSRVPLGMALDFINYFSLYGYGSVVCIDEMPMTRSMMDAYIDPVIQTEIDKFLADVLEG